MRRRLALALLLTLAVPAVAVAHGQRHHRFECPRGWLCTSVLPNHGYCRDVPLHFSYVARDGRVRRLDGDAIACLRVPLTIAQPDRLDRGGRVFREPLRFSWRGHVRDGLAIVCPAQRVVTIYEPPGVGGYETKTKTY